MWWVYILLGYFGVAVASREAYGRIGYFWHITDIHWDGHTNFHGEGKGCWRPEYEDPKGKSPSSTGGGGRGRSPVGRYGDYNCDSTWELIESAARAMMAARQNDNVEFVLWTGDALSHAAKRLPEDRQLMLLENLTYLLQKTFSSQFVFPALGHDEPVHLKKELGRMWARWLPSDSIKTFESGGFYLIERKMLKLQIVVLNTNLMRKDRDDEDSQKQWDWLEAVLRKCQYNYKTVYLVGHIAPGTDERQRADLPPAHASYSDYHNKKYLKIIRKYSNIIVGQFFGHLHSDTFRLVYDNGRPISFVLLAPSLTPKRTIDGPNNPGLRLYKFDQDTGQILDYSQYYFDLSAMTTDSEREPEWRLEYNFSTYYSINEITPFTLHQLAEKVSQPPNFEKYYRANAVRVNSQSSPRCDSSCRQRHYCAIARINYDDFHECLHTAASALSTSMSSNPVPVFPLVLTIGVSAIFITFM